MFGILELDFVPMVRSIGTLGFYLIYQFILYLIALRLVYVGFIFFNYIYKIRKSQFSYVHSKFLLIHIKYRLIFSLLAISHLFYYRAILHEIASKIKF